MKTPDQLRELVEQHLAGLQLVPELGDLTAPVRYGFEAGGERAARDLPGHGRGGRRSANTSSCGCGAELVHPLSLVHDDLPALDNDTCGETGPARGRASAKPMRSSPVTRCWRRRSARRSPIPTANVARELAEATLGMIGGQHLDVHGEVHDLAVLHRLKTGRLFAASVGCALWAAEVPVPDQLPWREFGEELGLLFQIVDDVLDEDGYFAIHGAEGARGLAMDAAARAHERLAEIDADTSVLGEIVTDLAVRTK